MQNTFQQFPIVAKDVVQHEAYRAMQSGLNEYQYAVNANADFAACSARFVNANGTSAGTSTLTSSSTVCSALSLGNVDLGARQRVSQRAARVVPHRQPGHQRLDRQR